MQYNKIFCSTISEALRYVHKKCWCTTYEAVSLIIISKQQTEGEESNVQIENMNLVWQCYIGSRNESLIKSYPEIAKRLMH